MISKLLPVVWGQLHPPAFTSQSCCLLSFKVKAWPKPSLWGPGWQMSNELRDAGLLNKWEEEEWLFQIRRERQKWESKPFRKQWPPTPHTPTTTSPCLPGPIDPLIRYSQSPLLRRPPPQLSVRDGMCGTAPLRITIPVIYCYNTASHFRGGWLERYGMVKGRGKGLISSPCLTPPLTPPPPR